MSSSASSCSSTGGATSWLDRAAASRLITSRGPRTHPIRSPAHTSFDSVPIVRIRRSSAAVGV